MEPIDLDNTVFGLVENSAAGTVNADTLFHYHQNGDLVTADYSGGTIRHGRIIAKRNGHELSMLYQCITTDGQLKAGRAMALIGRNAEMSITLDLEWEWLTDAGVKGRSRYVELKGPNDLVRPGA